MPRVVHFDISADEPEKAIKFYESVFGWKFQKWEGPMEYWMITTGDGVGIDGGLSKRNPQSQDINTIDVPDVDEYIKKAEENGAQIISAKIPIPGVGWFAIFKDNEGNVFGLMQDDTEAK